VKPQGQGEVSCSVADSAKKRTLENDENMQAQKQRRSEASEGAGEGLSCSLEVGVVRVDLTSANDVTVELEPVAGAKSPVRESSSQWNSASPVRESSSKWNSAILAGPEAIQPVVTTESERPGAMNELEKLQKTLREKDLIIEGYEKRIAELEETISRNNKENHKKIAMAQITELENENQKLKAEFTSLSLKFESRAEKIDLQAKELVEAGKKCSNLEETLRRFQDGTQIQARTVMKECDYAYSAAMSLQKEIEQAGKEASKLIHELRQDVNRQKGAFAEKEKADQEKQRMMALVQGDVRSLCSMTSQLVNDCVNEIQNAEREVRKTERKLLRARRWQAAFRTKQEECFDEFLSLHRNAVEFDFNESCESESDELTDSHPQSQSQP